MAELNNVNLNSVNLRVHCAGNFCEDAIEKQFNLIAIMTGYSLAWIEGSEVESDCN